MPVTPAISSAARTSSHLCGFTTAVTSFISCRLSVVLPHPAVTAGGNRGGLAASAGSRLAGRGASPVRDRSERRLVPVTRAHPDDRVDRLHPDLAVPDPAGLRGLHDDPDHVVGLRGFDHDLDPDLGGETDGGPP